LLVEGDCGLSKHARIEWSPDNVRGMGRLIKVTQIDFSGQ